MMISGSDEGSQDHANLSAAIRLLEGKYTLLILAELFAGTQRFSTLLRIIPGISRKTLSDKLRQFTELGLVSRHAFAEVPPRVEYTLTPHGAVLKELIGELEVLAKSLGQFDSDEVKLEAVDTVGRVYRCSDGEAAKPLRSKLR